MITFDVIKLTGNRELRRRMPLFDVALTLALAALVAAIATQRPALLALGAPFIVALAAAFALWKPLEGSVVVGVDTAHIVEGDEVNLLVDVVAGDHDLDRVEVELEVSDHLTPLTSLRAITSVPASGRRRVSFAVSADEWGIAKVEGISVRATDRFGMFGGAVQRPAGLMTMRIGLAEERLSANLGAEQFRSIVGSHLSHDRGDGLEIADIRPWLPGDSVRNINWRISNRRQEPWVTLRHPDRSANVVVVVDAHDGTGDAQRITHRRSAAAALALARGHLKLHDPVGLLVVGHTVRWLPPRLGRNHLLRIADELISVSDVPTASLRLYRPPALSYIGRETIVVAVSPLQDPLMIRLIAQLRSRGNPVVVLEPEIAPDGPPRLQARVERPVTRLARRFALAEREAGVQSLRSHGVALVSWKADEPATAVMAAVQRMRQSMARAGVR